MKRLGLGNLKISEDKISYLEVYCTKNAKKFLETGTGNLNLFDKLTSIRIRKQGEGSDHPPLYDTLIERTEFYGIKRELFTSVEEDFLPSKSIVITLVNQISQIGHPSRLMKPVYYPGLIGLEYQLELEPNNTLELTQKVRNFFPKEIVKEVNSYLQMEVNSYLQISA